MCSLVQHWFCLTPFDVLLLLFFIFLCVCVCFESLKVFSFQYEGGPDLKSFGFGTEDYYPRS